MAVILHFVFFVFLFLFIIVCITGLVILRSIRNVADRLKGNSRNTTNGSQRHNTYHNNAGEEVIIDHRSPDEANRKIFSEGEGEYIDFEEEK